MLNNDKPIFSCNDDLLNRSIISNELANAISSYNHKDSLVIGLYGEWGSGKTSLINLTIENLIKTKENNEFIIINFNPWFYSNTEQLIEYFFKELILRIGLKDNHSTLTEIAKKIEKYSKVFNKIEKSNIPFLKTIAGISTDVSNEFKNFIEFKAKEYEFDGVKLKEEINTTLERLNNKIIVIIDDIDRLSKSEIKEIFKLVKMIGDFRNMIYILAFDKSIIEKTLFSVQDNDGGKYLEKIIQVPINIPKISTTNLNNYLFKKLNEVLFDLDDNQFNKNYWANVYIKSSFLLKNLRDINRFINYFRFKYNLLKGEVNIVDLIAITLIEIKYPELFERLKINKNILTGLFQNSTNLILSGYDDGENEKVIKEFNSIINETVHSEYERNKIRELLSTLFPKFNNKNYIRSIDEDFKKLKRISSKDVFDIYFSLSFENNYFKNSEFLNYISQNSNFDELNRMITSFSSEGKILDFLYMLDELNDIKYKNINIYNILLSIYDFANSNKSKSSEALFSLSLNLEQLVYLNTVNLLRNFNAKKREIIISDIIRNTSNSIYLITVSVYTFGVMLGKYGEQKAEDKVDIIFDEKTQSKFEKQLVLKIENWINTKQIFNDENITKIFLYYELFIKVNSTKLNRFKNKITTILKDDKLFILFILRFLNKSYSYSYKKDEVILSININGLKSYFDLNTLLRRLKKLLKSKDSFIRENINELEFIYSELEKFTNRNK
ncbi:MAG TPA: P-loop NTPase fold protein [Ignavibacteria bacterium]|nr:P-loop NTPase fold protein [Ignavibacteria bacterium]